MLDSLCHHFHPLSVASSLPISPVSFLPSPYPSLSLFSFPLPPSFRLFSLPFILFPFLSLFHLLLFPLAFSALSFICPSLFICFSPPALSLSQLSFTPPISFLLHSPSSSLLFPPLPSLHLSPFLSPPFSSLSTLSLPLK